MIVLALNGGSSSLKYALFDDAKVLRRGEVDRIAEGDQAAAVAKVLAELPARPDAVGHRLVHGGPDHHQPVRVDADLLAVLARAVPFAPLHLPVELRTIGAVREHLGEVVQVVCFDTGFHAGMPEVARRFALPAALHDAGLHRYGFHGLSYEHLVATLPLTSTRQAILAHLGSGASMVAVRDGCSVDTTMGLTPTGGLVMGTRSGDLDPGLLVYLLDHGYDARSLEKLVEHEAGLRGLSGTTSDMRQLAAARATDPRAALAIDVFCYQARKWIGALAAALGGVDTLVFTGGIGAHAADIRAAICGPLAHLGIALAGDPNATHAPVIGSGRCEVRVVVADEEQVIARHTRRLVA
jgi:acetate kinase